LKTHEEASSAKAKLSLPKEELLPKPEDPKEDPKPIDLSPFDDDLFEALETPRIIYDKRNPQLLILHLTY
jgi:hypothetical protein